ncbi:MAG: hypothetical protein NT007_12085 [Candidatus Kapabacteria bacterium]|nr:hypothetical protein [Candidatus Kapabacteria bacterium]
MKKYNFIALLFFIGKILYAQPLISYIIPDIGTPNMNTYIEIIAPTDSNGNFGADGFFLNNTNDNVQIIFGNSSDASKIVFGPLVVSWNGRLISTQVFVNPWLKPNDWDWKKLTPEFKIPFKVKVGPLYTNIDTFYIVQPFHLGNNIAGAGGVLGSGANFGIRSRRGAMIVDSMNLGPFNYTVSTSDCDPYTNGNQGFLPFVLISVADVQGAGVNSKIIVDGTGKHGGTGGGGAGAHFCDNMNGSGNEGGNGFSGGGKGGNNKFPTGSSTSICGIGSGTGPVTDPDAAGYSLNKVKGGFYPGAYESAGGGTGHPFGSSGSGCGDGNNCDPAGAYGGGSGYRQDKPGGAAGNATAGLGQSLTGGKVHGNIMVVPIYGGSGGAGGNPQRPFSGCSGAGGGGGGAVSVYGRNIINFAAQAAGANGENTGTDNGGSGSGGFTGIQSKLGVDQITLSAPGGVTAGVYGGDGRIRWDTPKFGKIYTSGKSESYFRGPTTDTSSIVKYNCLLSGSFNSLNNSEKNIKVYKKSESTPWVWVGDVTYSSPNAWNINPKLTPPDTIFYISVMQDINNPDLTSQYRFEPVSVMSQASANILHTYSQPKIAGDSIIIETIPNCSLNEVTDTATIYNRGDGNLILEFNNSTFEYGKPGYTLVSPTKSDTLKPNDSVKVIVKYKYQKGAFGRLNEVLWVQHNDKSNPKNPWEIEFFVDVQDYNFKPFDIQIKKQIDTLYLGSLCSGDIKDTVFAMNNLSQKLKVTLKDPVVQQTAYFSSNVIGAKLMPPLDTAAIKVRFVANVPDTGRYVSKIYFSIEECPDFIDSILVIADVQKPVLQIIGNNNFGYVKIGTDSTLQYTVKNIGNKSAYIKTIVLPSPFAIIKFSKPLPFELKPGESFTIDVRYTPTAEVSDSTLLVVPGIANSVACPDTTKIMLFGIGANSKLIVSKYLVDFGTVPWCLGSVKDSVFLKNNGSVNVTIKSITWSIKADSLNCKVTTSYTVPTLLPGDSIWIYFEFLPNKTNNPDPVLNVVVTTDDANKKIINIKLIAHIQHLDITAIPNPVNLGNCVLNSSITLPVKLTNNGFFPEHVTNIVSQTGLFAPNQLSFTIGSKATQNIDITFTPVVAGLVFDTLLIIFDTPCKDSLILPVSANCIEGNYVFFNPLNAGIVAPCEQKIVPFTLTNTGQAAFRIDSIQITGPDASLFIMDPNPALPFTLNPSATFTKNITFIPLSANDGVKNAFLTFWLYINGVTKQVQAQLIGERQVGIVASPAQIDFGTTIMNLQKPRTLLIKNKGVHVIQIKNILPLGFPTVFSTNPATLNKILNPGDSVSLIVNFVPDKVQSYTDVLKFDVLINTCPEILPVNLSGAGSPPVSMEIFLPDTTVESTFRDFHLPVWYNSKNIIDPLTGMSVNFTFKYNTNLYYPQSVSNGTLINGLDSASFGRANISLKNITLQSGTNQILTEIIGATLLGSIESDSLLIDNLTWSPVTVMPQVTHKDGKLTTKICKAGGSRLILKRQSPTLIIKPNPASDAIDIDATTLMIGEHKLDIIDLQGNSINLIKWNISDINENHYNFEFDTKTISTGTYFMMLTGPGNRIVVPVYIIK